MAGTNTGNGATSGTAVRWQQQQQQQQSVQQQRASVTVKLDNLKNSFLQQESKKITLDSGSKSRRKSNSKSTSKESGVTTSKTTASKDDRKISSSIASKGLFGFTRSKSSLSYTPRNKMAKLVFYGSLDNS